MKVNLKIGEEITNSDIHKIFGVSEQGGMRKSNKNNCLVLISKSVDNPYSDIWDKDILLYSGMGQNGDQQMNYKQNRTLNDSKTNGVKVYLFMFMKTNTYKYYGEVQLIDNYPPFYRNDPIDEFGNTRKVAVFPLQFNADINQIHEANKMIDEERPIKIHKNKTKKHLQKLMRDAKIQQFQNERAVPKKVVNELRHIRNIEIVELARIFAEGVCQLCEQEAPFKDKNGSPFLEVHHIKWLSQGGSDTINNVIAICPNCHRRMHIVNDPIDVDKLKSKAKKFAEERDLI
ncbi:HNH endonuclease [Apilactobacillus xinyiensis]|uniref:HNH endonuclease n=1 Tax=Apilactobacillus xinyiensis TaxID=2841032 RepID=UPI00200F56F7|nr:HNH endonuclease signature motif containing protein [Apilactobacillus xinyiensis]MCL0329836.1 HNH endonuclease [Apilactobacillus xinyiensis]